MAALIAVAVAGCAVSTPSPSPSTPTAAVLPSPSAEASSPAVEPAFVPVPIEDYATQIDFFGAGVDFDSVDGNIHCGIWDAYGDYGQDPPVLVSYAGCRPREATYETDPSNLSGVIGCRGGELLGEAPPAPVCNSGQAFVGEAPQGGPVGILAPGQSIAFAGRTCVAIDSATIECSRDADGAGFTVGRDSYRYFDGE